MQIQVQLVLDNGEPIKLTQLQRDDLSPATVGLTLAESKEILHTIQVHLVEKQVKEYQQQQRSCPDCQPPDVSKSIVPSSTKHSLAS